MIAHPTLRLWTRDDYYRMAQTGILHPDEPVELIAGQIIRKMSPQGSYHASGIRRTHRWFAEALQSVALIQTQLPIQLRDDSEPEPDVAILKPDLRDYSDRHPTAADVLLLIEVADSTLAYDCGTKARVYAQTGIADYWVLDVARRQLHLFRDPTPEGYRYHQIFPADATVQPLCFREWPTMSQRTVAIASLLPYPPVGNPPQGG